MYPIETNVWRHGIMNGYSSIAHFQFANYSFTAKWGQGRTKHRAIVTWYFTCDNKIIWCRDFSFVYALIQAATTHELFCTKISSKYSNTASDKKQSNESECIHAITRIKINNILMLKWSTTSSYYKRIIV